MNISLIFPLLSKRRAMIDENKQYWPPLGLAYIAAVLEEGGHNIQIIDRDVILRKNKMNFDKMDNLMLEEIKDFRPDLIGISATTPIMSDADHVARYLKESYKDVRVIVGGPHPTAEPISTLAANPFIDAVVMGEGELTVRDIADGVTFDKIKGLVYRSDSRIISNPERPPAQNIDDFPLPARHLLDMKFYTRPSRFIGRNLSVRTTSIFTARGCPYRCNFCSGPRIFSGKVRFHSPARVINEMEELISKYSVEALYFAEDMFLSSKNRAEELLNLFIEKNINKKIKWMAQAKASIITKELLTLMKEAGCVGIEYGFESGSQRVLDLMNKNLKVEDSVKAAELTRKMGIRFQANMIAGYPGERKEDFEKSIELIRKISPNMTALNIFMALPGTPSYEKLKSEGRELPRWDDLGDPETTQNNFADMPKSVFDKMYLETRLKVILPMNLRSFVIDNLNNPLRLLSVALTQFKGVLVKTMRSILKLIFLNKETGTSKKTNVLFMSYNGLLEPILPSQGIPYLKGLAKNDYNFVLLTYEKKSDLKRVGREGLKKLKGELKSDNIEWRYLTYHKSPRLLSTLFDLFLGMVQAFYIIGARRIRIVHIRGITPGIMMIALSRILNVKILFDMRGLLAEEYVGGGLWKENSLPFRMIKTAERHMLETADAVSVLTKKHYDLNRTQDYLRNRNIAMSVIPCCVDMGRFYYDKEKEMNFKKELGLENKFVLMYPGKIGTFYLMDEMIAFYKAMLNLVPDSIFFILTNDPSERVVEKAQEMGLDRDRIRILNNVGFADMPRYLRVADAGIFFINPYKKFGSSPIKLGEFLASGVPVVINPGVGDTEEIVKNNKVGVIVTEFSDSYYKNSAHELIELVKEGPDDMKKRCRDTAERYLSLEEGINKYLTLSRSLS